MNLWPPLPDLGERIYYLPNWPYPVTNGAEHIWNALSMDFPNGPITQIELYRHARDGEPGLHFDQYIGHPEWVGDRWRPMSDISPLHPDHDVVTVWTTKWSNIITEA